MNMILYYKIFLPCYFNFYFTLFYRLMEEKEERISDLEGSLSQLKKEAEDMTQLLEGVQNDKTALSRALTQNKDLKQQLVELQNGFVKMVGSSAVMAV